jgi:predicted metal-binding membrane protein
MASERASQQAFLGVSALLFAASAAATVHWAGMMSAGMPMPGGWTLSMTWMRMPGQTWLGAATAFMGMWVAMMVAMMLPSLVPVLSHHRRSAGGLSRTRLSAMPTVLGGLGYFAVWAAFGAIAYGLGLVLAAAELRWPAFAGTVPMATGGVVLLAGCVQLTGWKARQLRHCRQGLACGQPMSWDARSSWREGLRQGIRCGLCCSGLMMVLLVMGMMNLWVLAMVALAITAERLARRPEAVARAAGVVVIAVGALLVARALGTA